MLTGYIKNQGESIWTSKKKQQKKQEGKANPGDIRGRAF